MSKGTWREFDDFATQAWQDDKRPSQLGKADRKVRVQRTKSGKGGKTVTLITGLDLDEVEARILLKTLKKSCGTGGTVKQESIELQGDQVGVVLELLYKEGYRPKKAGG